MKRRLVLRFETFYDDYNSRSKAMKAVVSADGVTSVILDEKDESKMVVIGEEMDAYGLLNILKKRNLKAHMESLKEIKHERKEHHGKDKMNVHHKKKETKDKKKHGHSYSDSVSRSGSGSSSSSSSSSDSESDSDKKKHGHHHNRWSSSSSSDSESDSDKKKHGHYHNRWSSSSGSRSDSDSDKKKRGHHHNQRTYIYQPTYPPQIYPALSPYEEGNNYNYPTSRY